MAASDESPNPNKGRSSGTAKQAQAKASDDAATAASKPTDEGSTDAGSTDARSTDAEAIKAKPVAKPKTANATDSATPGDAEPEAATFADAIAGDGPAPVSEPATADVSAADVLTTVTAERDEYLEAMQRLKAEFANHKRRTSEQQSQQREQAAAGLVEKLLPVLDGCDAAMAHEPDAVRPISDALIDALTKEGLTRIEPEGDVFDPESHEAVMHEEGDGSSAQPLVVEVLRAGYSWNGRVLRPAMVKVKG